MPKLVGRISDHVIVLLGGVSGAAVFMIMVLVSYSAVARYFFNNPIHITEDVSALFLMIHMLLGLAYVFKLGGHVRISLFVDRLPLKARSYLGIVTDLLVLLFLIILTKESISFTHFGFQLGCRSESCDIYLPPWMVGMCLGIAVFAIAVFLSLVQRIRAIVA